MKCWSTSSAIVSSLTNSTSFMQSLQWVDTTYIQKHNSEDPDTLRAMYYPNLVMYPTNGQSRPVSEAVMAFTHRYAKRMGMLLGLYILSLVPIIGRYVMPVASFYTFRTHVGTAPATAIFGAGLVLPKAIIVRFLHTYFASRGLMRELVSNLQLPCRIRANDSSLTHISVASSSRLNKSGVGFVIVRVCSLDSRLPLQLF